MKVEPLWWDWCPYRGMKRSELSLSAMWGYREKVVHQEEGPRRAPDHAGTLILGCQLPKTWAINTCCLSHPVSGILLKQPSFLKHCLVSASKTSHSSDFSTTLFTALSQSHLCVYLIFFLFIFLFFHLTSKCWSALGLCLETYSLGMHSCCVILSHVFKYYVQITSKFISLALTLPSSPAPYIQLLT